MPKTAQSDGSDRADPLAEAWRERFTARRDAHVPAPRDGLERVSEPGVFRVRVSGAKRYAFGAECARVAARGNALGARVACSFYDESTGRFFGTTTSGAVAPVALPAALGRKQARDAGDEDADEDAVGDVDCALDAFFVTEIRDARRLAVFEIVLVETHPSTGLVLRESSGGWAARPVDERERVESETEVSFAASAMTASASSSSKELESENALPVLRGSPRYLAWGAPRTGARLPEPMDACALSVAIESICVGGSDGGHKFPKTLTSFLEHDALVPAEATIPGLAGTLAGPDPMAPRPLRAVSLGRARLAVPSAMARVLAASLGENWPSATSSWRLALRVAAHNGDAFVGAKDVLFDAFAFDGDARDIVRLKTDAVVPDVPHDATCALVVEAVVVVGDGDSKEVRSLGWAPVAPFEASETNATDGEGDETKGAEGNEALRRGARECAASLGGAPGPRPEPTVDWRDAVNASRTAWATAARATAAAAAAGTDRETFALEARVSVAAAAPETPPRETEETETSDPTPILAPAPELSRPATGSAPTPPPPTSSEPPLEASSEPAEASSEPPEASSEPPEASSEPPPASDSRPVSEPAVPSATPQSPPPPPLASLASQMEAQMAQMQAMEARLERAATPAKRPSPAENSAGPAASPRSEPNVDEKETEPETGIGSQMHSPVVPPAANGVSHSESPAALPREAARVLFGEEGALEEASEPAVPNETKETKEETFADVGASARRRVSAGGFSRATRARLHAAGADAALPPDVRLALRASTGGAAVATTTTKAEGPRALSRLDVLAELEDSRDVDDVVVQFLAFRSFPEAKRTFGFEDADSAAFAHSRDRGGSVGRMTDGRVDGARDAHAGAGDALRSLASVRFTFDFFDFPTVTSRACGLTEATKPGEPRLVVPAVRGRRFEEANASSSQQKRNAAADAKEQHSSDPQRAGEAWFRFTVDGRAGNGAGDAVADDAESVAARRASFARYVARGGPVSVDVWDAQSLLQVGVCELDVSALMRRGRDVADTLVEAFVRDHVSPSASGAERRPLGALLVRLVNVGRRASGGEGVAADNLFADAKPGATPRVRAAPDSGGDLAASLRAGECPAEARESRAARAALEAQETRKLARERRLREIRGEASSSRGARLRAATAPNDAGETRIGTVASGDSADSVVRAKLLESVDAARRRAKREAVLRKLREMSEFKKTVRPRFGELCFFEHPFRNGSDREKVFEIRCDDKDIVLVTSAAEREALRELCARDDDDEGARGDARRPKNAFVDLEDDAFDGNRLFLAAGESARLAFTFQSFETYGERTNADGPQLRPRSAVIHFVDTSEGVTAHALVVDVRPRAPLIARAFQFHASEEDFWKAEIPVPARALLEGVTLNPSGRVTARASDPAVAATVVGGELSERAFSANERTDVRDERPGATVSLRAKCGAAAAARSKERNGSNLARRTFFVNIYGDERLATLLLTWRVTLRVATKVDIAATVGQTTRASVAVTGMDPGLADANPRRLVAYTSRPAELRASLVAPAGPEHERARFAELTLAFKPRAAGRSLDVVHLIDDSTGALAHVRLVASDARAPTPSRVFDARVAAAVQTHKKVSYSNPYATRRAFVLRSTHPELLRFRPAILELAPAGEEGATRFFGMTFAPSEAWTTSAGGKNAFGSDDAMRRDAEAPNDPTEVTVFVNDEQDATEECFRVRVFAAEEVDEVMRGRE